MKNIDINNKTITIFGLSGASYFYSVDEFNIPGETKQAKEYYFEMGGKGHNQAVACKRLGANVNFIAAFGNDIEAKSAIKSLKNEGINIYPIYKNSNTASAVIITNENAMNKVIVYQGANSLMEPNDIKKYETTIKNSDIILLQLEIPYNVTKEIVKIANKNGVRVILNPAPYQDVSDLEQVYILTPNEIEAKELKCLPIHSYLITTLGSKGALINNSKLIESFKTNAVDSTGAGDVFNGALAVACVNDFNIEDAVIFANAAASLSVRKKHVINSIPYLEDVKKILNG